MGAHNERPLVLLICEFMGGGVKFARLNGGERGDMGLKIPAVGTKEVYVAHEVKVSDIDQLWDPVQQDIYLHRPNIAGTILVTPPQ